MYIQALFRIPKHHLYLFQLENYEPLRFLRLLWKKGLAPGVGQRKDLVWTAKATLLFLSGQAIMAGAAAAVGWFVYSSAVENKLAAAIIFFGLIAGFNVVSFIFFLLADLLFWPIDAFVKFIIVQRAKARLRSMPAIRIVAIAGSYGKTTMKEVLKQVLGVTHRVVSTPESVNTPLGIARWILQSFISPVDVAIVEMGEHYRGDVERICEITKPDIAVVTGINEAHLERLKKMEAAIATVFEVVSCAKAGATIVLNGDDSLVTENYKKYVWPDHIVESYGKNSVNSKFKIRNSKFDPDQLGWNAEFEGVGHAFVSLLGEYALADVQAAVTIASRFGMAPEEMKKGIESIQPVEHRLQPIRSGGDVLVIDDSYNGNPAGVAEAIRTLSRFENRRKVYITPGLVEMGTSTAEVHRQIGRQLAGVADVVILIKNSASPFIESGILNHELHGKKGPKVVWFTTAPEAHAALKDILKPGDVVLFQNDWGDQYI